MRGAFERDAAPVVYPGGVHETYRPSCESSEIGFAGPTGFVAIGGQETGLFLGRGPLASAFQLNRLCA